MGAWLGDGLVPAILVAGLPFVLSAVTAGLAHLAHRWQLARHGHRELPRSAGGWVTDRLHDLGLAQHVQVRSVAQDDGGFDAYWPARALIALRAPTFHGRTPMAWAIGAHELGHALNLAGSPIRERVYTAARLLSLVAGQVFVAILLTNVLYGAAHATVAALVAAVVAAVAHAVVVHDEAEASRMAWRLLRDDESLGEPDREAARVALASALSVYAAGLVGRLAVLASWGIVVDAVAGGAGPAPAEMTYLAAWIVIVTAPILLLRGAHVVVGVFRPERIESHLQMAWTGPREASWDFLTGLLLLVLLASVWNRPVVDGALPWVALAAVPAVVPLALLGRLAVLVPLLVGLRAAMGLGTRWGILAEPSPLQRHLDADRDALFGDGPSWLLRAVGLLRVAYVPLVLFLLARMLDGGGF